GLDLAPGQRPAGQALDEVAVRLADLHLVVAGPLHIAADGEHPRALRLLGAELRVGGGAVFDDPGHGGDRLDVVHGRRAAPNPLLRRIRRLPGARLRALALQRFEQRAFLAADVRAMALEDADVQGPVRA